jgi:dimethylaniline monooxygenase (N-oxide forming)
VSLFLTKFTGWSGLVTAKTYLQTKPDAKILIVDNASTIGGTWCQERLYPHLVAEAHHGLFEFSDLEMPCDGKEISHSGIITGKAVHDYLSSYAKRFGLHKRLRLNTIVKRVSRDGKHWHLALSDTKEVLVSEKLVIATGLTSEPFMPDIPNNGFTRDVMHSKELGNPNVVKKISERGIQSVVVYGASKSAFDAVNLLLRAGKYVQWVVRGGEGGPSIMTPLIVLGQPSFRLNNSRFLALFSPNLFRKDGLARWLHSTGPKWLTQPIVMAFWRVVSFFLHGEAQYGKSENSNVLKPKMGLDSLFWSPATLGVMTHPGLWKDIHEGSRVHVRENTITGLDAKGVKLDNGTTIPTDMVVLATGWKSFPTKFLFSDEDRLKFGLPSVKSFDSKVQHRWLTLRQQADLGVTNTLPILSESPRWDSHNPRVEDDFHLYRSIIPASSDDSDRSLAYVGFLRTTVAPMVYEAQALWATAYLQGKLEVPSQERRETDTAWLNAWIRRRYICGRKVPFAMFEFLPVSLITTPDFHTHITSTQPNRCQYVSVLYDDLGINSKRKSNPFAELFGLYKPNDFKGVVDEWMEDQSRSHQDSETTNWPRLITVLSLVSVVVTFAVCFSFTSL